MELDITNHFPEKFIMDNGLQDKFMGLEKFSM